MRIHLITFFFVVLFTSVTYADLVHRYSFDNGDTTAVDSVGGKHGTLIAGAAINANAVRLNGNGAYVNLPASAIAVHAFEALTLELWSTQPEIDQGFSMTIALGGTWPNGLGLNYLMLCTTRGDNVSRSAIAITPNQEAPWSNEIGVNGPELNDGREHHYVLTINATQITFYIDGNLQGSAPLGSATLSGLSDQYAYLGKSVYTGDATVNCSVNEFRIHDTALTQEEVESSYAQGPDTEYIVHQATRPFPADQSRGVDPGTQLSWRPPTEAPDSYTVYIINKNDVTKTQILEVPGDANHCDPVLEYSTTYEWRVVARFQGATYLSDTWTITTAIPPPDFSPIGDLNGDFYVDWKDMGLFAQQWLDDGSCMGLGCADFDGQNGTTFVDFALLAQNWNKAFVPVIINEIHYHPDHNKEAVEFIELYNASTESVDVSGWSFSSIDYVFPANTRIEPRDYLVVCEEPQAVLAKFGVTGLGPFTGQISNEGERLVLMNAVGHVIDEVDYGSDFPWPMAANGEGASLELINPALDNDLAGSWRSSGYRMDRPELAFGMPTPGQQNTVYTTHVPPQIRQVDHEPQQARSDQPVKITAKITDPDGVDRVSLQVQVVHPGDYIPAYLPLSKSALLANPYQLQPRNPDFENPNNWTTWTMVDDGTGQDEIAGDHIYTTVIPGQGNRTLVRYRITASDLTGDAVQVPYADDASLNFAYYVYNGVPDYVAAEDSVHPEGPGHVYTAEILTSIPVYTLITRAQDLYQCNGYNAADRLDQGTTNVTVQDAGRAYNWEGAFVYEGQVYDHIGYRLRGGNGRYNYNSFAGKRSMKFRFNRGNYLQARDIYGNTFPSKWQHLNTGKMVGNQILFSSYDRYPYGLNEIMDMRLFEAVGVPAPQTWWMHFRVVDGAEESPTGANGQYRGDFWGLHVAFENYDSAFLERLGLPKGNLYKLSDKVYDGPRQLRYQGPDAVDDASDYENIRWNLTHEASADFIRTYLDCDEWYRYHTVTEAIRHYDIFSGATCVHCLKNTAWFFAPDDSGTGLGKLQFLPFDVDDTWGPYFNSGTDHAKAAIYDQRFLGGLEQFPLDPEKSPLKQDYRNAIREFRDLHWQPEVVNGMIDELASVIADFVPADRDRWRRDDTVPGTPLDNGTLEEGVALMKQFAWSPGSFRGGFYWVGSATNLDMLANAENDAIRIPDTPTIHYIGAENYPLNDLWFETSAFSDPQGSGTFSAMKWRIAEYDLNYSATPGDETVLLEPASDWTYFKGNTEPSSPDSAWRQIGFNDDSWLLGQTPIGYSDNDDNTDLSLDTPPMRDNYTSVYLRNTFNIPNKNLVQSLTLYIYVDDGCIIWINGTEVKRMYCSDGFKAYNSLTGETDHEAVNYEAVTLAGPYDYLVNGTNVIAVHALQTTTTSSDFSIDVSISLSDETLAPPSLGPSRYEIDTLWESDELTDPGNRFIQIPAAELEPGKTYRVRSRMKDATDRWSHWSPPIEFMVGEAVGTDLIRSLRVNELMYNPPAYKDDPYDNDEYEFIELKNISSSETLDLSTVSFTDGIEFSFADSRVTSLEPGECVLMVKNETAFVSRYGTALSDQIAGSYSGQFANNGERVEISDVWNGIVVSFTYNDNQDWPQTADGQGDSLVPRTWWLLEDLQAGIMDDPHSWQASTPTPGQ